jgi:hypothetical protein
MISELWLKIYPITLGTGQRLFAASTIPTAFKVRECKDVSSYRTEHNKKEKY